MRRFCNPSRLTAYLHRRRSSRKHHQGGHVGELLTCRSYGWAVCAGTHEAMAASKDAELGGNQVFRLVTAGTWQEEENTHDLSFI